MDDNINVLECTSNIVSAYVSNNLVKTSEISGLIDNIYRKLTSLGVVISSSNSTPAVPIEESIFPDYIICLEDGKKLKMLKRHLRTMYNLSVEDYKRKWDLPPEYPTVARNYALKRSALAKAIGLGKKPEQESKVTLRIV